MTVPVQRGAGSDDPTVNSLILGRLDDLANGFQRLEDRITQRVEGLSEQFVPRGEYEARHGEVRNLITLAEARIDAEATARKDLEDKLTSGRRWAIGACLMGLGVLVALLSPILTHLPH